MKKEQIAELLYQALETEKGGVEIYETAVRCAVNEDLKEEWEKYLEQTERHVEVMEGLFETFGLDPETDTPGRLAVRHIGESLGRAMEMAMDAGNADAAQIVAAECIALAETKDHLNWQLMGQVAKKLTGDEAKALMAAHEEVEEEDMEPLETSLERLAEGQDDGEEDDFFKLDDPVEDADEDDEDNIFDNEDDED
mgnify:CR=1 FL=1